MRNNERKTATIILLFLEATQSSSHSTNSSDWYTRYPSYPQYCSTPDQLSSRKIPLLNYGPILESAKASDGTHEKKVTQILHVTTMIRHGSRTPWSAHNCWSGFWSKNASTATWDCSLNTLSAPPAKPEISFLEQRPLDASGNQAERVELDGLGAMFLFEKRYDALQSPRYNLKNELNGTCQSGQLLLRGYAQEMHNGKMLRSTYIRKNTNPIPDHMALFDFTEGGHSQRPYEAPHLYVRSDDSERTIMSGQVLLRGLFGDLLQKHWDNLRNAAADTANVNDPTIVVHTADKWRDILSPNAELCPRLKDLHAEAENSPQFVEQFLQSEESRIMNKLIRDLGGDFFGWGEAQDCMMTAICNDLDLPKLLDDYENNGEREDHSYGKNLFRRLDRFSYQPYNYVLRYNDAAYSKLGLAPLWIEILSNILPHLKQDIQRRYNRDGNIKSKEHPPKLALFSAHDTTILLLLATLGEEVWDGEDWPPYASLIVIELHNILISSEEISKAYPSGQAFRIVYNGDVITPKMRGCLPESDLCDVSILLDRVLSFATENRNCDPSGIDRKKNIMSVEFPVTDVITVLMSSWKGIFVVLLIVFVSGMVGCLTSFVFLRGRSPNFCRLGRKYIRSSFENTKSAHENDQYRENCKLKPSYGTVNQSTVN